MTVIPVSGEAVRRNLRTAAVGTVAVAALAFSLPNLLQSTNPLALGTFGFYTSANVVVYADARAKAAGVSIGDRIDYFRMAPNERYGNPQDGLREPPAGKKVSFVVDRHGSRHVATLAAEAFKLRADWHGATSLLQLTAQKAIFFVLVLLALALLVIRPEPLTASLFLFVAGNGVMPLMYSFLPAAGYAAVMAADDAIAGLGAIGFLGLALCLDPKRQVRSRQAVGIGALLLALIVVPIAISDVLEIMAGRRPAWPLAGWVSFSVLWFCYVAGFVLLFRVAAAATTPRSLRLLAGLLAAVGALTIVYWTLNVQPSTWYFANLPAVVMNRGVIADGAYLIPTLIYTDALFILRLLGALLAFYLIIRAGLADAGPVYRRIVAYIIVALLTVALSSFATIALMRFATYVVIVPLEIFAAIAIGYWVSGLRDLAGCLSLGCVDAWTAWANGRLQEERDALAQSLGLAQRTRRRGIIAEVRAQIAFSSWCNGEDGAFEQKVNALQRVLRGHNMRGIRGFAYAATSADRDIRFDADDLPEWKARAALVLCARTDDAARAQQFALDALASADRAALPSLQVLAAVAVAETCADRRNSSLERAHTIARDSGWVALSKSILSLRANSRDIGVLQMFVDVRLRKSRPVRPTFQVSFFNAELCVNGARATLSEKQLELLLTVALARAGINDADLLDTLWPESEGDAARNSLRVCLHGLRKSAGDARIITRVGKGLVLHQWAEVDLVRFHSLLAACRDSGGRAGADELRRLCLSLRAGEGRRATLGDWFFRFEQILDRRLDEAERLLARVAERGAQ